MLTAYGDNIWAKRTPMKMMGIDLSTQMTVVRLPDRSLLLISPVTITDELREEIATLGKVSAIISPNTFHHLHVSSALGAFPQADYYCPASLPQRVKELPASKDLYALDKHFWQGQLETLRACPSHMADEIILFHPGSKTLIVTDLIQYSDGHLAAASKLFAFMAGTLRKPAISRLFRTMIKDKEEVRGSLRTILQWDFERILLPHNTNIEKNARQVIENILHEF